MAGKQKHSIDNDEDLESQWTVNPNLVMKDWYPKEQIGRTVKSYGIWNLRVIDGLGENIIINADTWEIS